jgi:Uri superfamily endonuclease
MRAETAYQLLIDVPRPVRVTVGSLGTFAFPAGRYVYTGSAKRNLEARIARHLRPEKALRWHIDYLLAAPGVRVVDVLRSRRGECALNRAVRGHIPVAGFGASDCSAGCGAHLQYLGRGDGSQARGRAAKRERGGNAGCDGSIGPDRLF